MILVGKDRGETDELQKTANCFMWLVAVKMREFELVSLISLDRLASIVMVSP